MEIFFVTSVASVLAIRAFLHLTGYPKFSPGSLHVAHVLVGGLFMLEGVLKMRRDRLGSVQAL